jgi:hypothetical protein
MPTRRATTLKLTPLADLLQAPGLVWLVQATPKRFDSALMKALETLVPAAQLDGFRRRNAGIDLREQEEVVVASYGEVLVYGVRGAVSANAIESAFRARGEVAARAIDHAPDRAEDRILRVFGQYGGKPSQVAIFGESAVLLEEGVKGPIRAATLFARGLLKRAKPCLHEVPLAGVAEALGDAPLRVFAPGPFDHVQRESMGGLLQVTSALGARARIVDGVLQLSLVARGPWGRDAEGAKRRLSAAFDLVTQSGLGKLMTLDKPVTPVETAVDGDNLWIHAGYNPTLLASAIRAAVEGEIGEIMTR